MKGRWSVVSALSYKPSLYFTGDLPCGGTLGNSRLLSSDLSSRGGWELECVYINSAELLLEGCWEEWQFPITIVRITFLCSRESLQTNDVDSGTYLPVFLSALKWQVSK